MQGALMRGPLHDNVCEVFRRHERLARIKPFLIVALRCCTWLVYVSAVKSHELKRGRTFALSSETRFCYECERNMSS